MGLKKFLQQRPEFDVALKQDAHLAETQRQREEQHFGGEIFDYYVDWKTGWRYYREPRGNPPAASSSSTSQWQDMATE